ncbi:unnamed protein product, partial [Symbiodinium sp. CCMP2592]
VRSSMMNRRPRRRHWTKRTTFRTFVLKRLRLMRSYRLGPSYLWETLMPMCTSGTSLPASFTVSLMRAGTDSAVGRGAQRSSSVLLRGLGLWQICAKTVSS